VLVVEAADPSKTRALTLSKRESLKRFGFTIALSVRQVHVIANVMVGGEAEKAGLRKWDKILEM